MKKSLWILLMIGLTGNNAWCGDYSRNESLHVSMRDGVRIAIDVWLPADLEHGQKVPALMHATRYWRAMQHASGSIENDNRFEEAERVNAAGYALILVDARGSGASFGWRAYERSVAEATDYGEVVDWIVEQPWSNQKVGAYGVSYAGNTAELLLINRHPAVRAIAPLFNDFDNFGHLAYPGSVFTSVTLQRWGNRISDMDRNDICALREVEGADCDALRETWLGVKPVDADTDGALLKAAVDEHDRNVHAFQAASHHEFRDDPWGLPDGVRNAGYLGSPAGHLDSIEASGVAMFIRAGWQDAATVNGTLGRYMTISNPQQVYIGPWDHGARNDADPFNPHDTPVSPNPESQFKQLITFFDKYLKDDFEPVESSITYYTLGADRWTTTTDWPPPGTSDQDWYLAGDGFASTEVPTGNTGADTYRIDVEATTGRHNRWHTNNGGGGDVRYNDRAAQGDRLLTYTSNPFDEETEITGHPVVTLFVRSTHDDGAFFVYLEDVAPGGTVTYITEGQLRAITRTVSDQLPPYRKIGPHRSELRADAMPLVPGEVAELTFELWATSVLIKKDHRIRIGIAGADRDTFAHYPLSGEVPTITVERNARYPSKLVLPVMRR